jgi:hypothetical protein
MYPTKLVTTKTVESETDETEGKVSELVEENSAEVRNKFQASLYLASVNMSKHGKVIDELQHQYINKQDNYPSTPEDAMTMLSHRQDTTHKKKFHKEKEKSTDNEIGIANFAQQTQRTLPKRSQTPKTTTTVASAPNNLARVLPNATLLAGTVKTVSLRWKQQECVGDRVITLTSLLSRIHILTITIAIIFFKLLYHGSLVFFQQAMLACGTTAC